MYPGTPQARLDGHPAQRWQAVHGAVLAAGPKVRRATGAGCDGQLD
jgi:hypothetical protein